jgi:hypothetical protein
MAGSWMVEGTPRRVAAATYGSPTAGQQPLARCCCRAAIELQSDGFNVPLIDQVVPSTTTSQEPTP